MCLGLADALDAVEDGAGGPAEDEGVAAPEGDPGALGVAVLGRGEERVGAEGEGDDGGAPVEGVGRFGVVLVEAGREARAVYAGTSGRVEGHVELM